MKKSALMIFTLMLVSMATWSQQGSFARGQKVYLTGDSKEIVEEIRQGLQEWGYWQVVSGADEADFKMNVLVSVSGGVTWTSWGGRSIGLTAVLTKGEQRWNSPHYKASPNGSNSFNSQRAAVRKLVNGLKKQYR